jgi:hypothetical protein
MTHPPQFLPIQSLAVSDRWFPHGHSFGLYESGGVVAPNVTSILSKAFPFDRAAWVEKEPDIDHDAVTREAAERGTAVHQAMEYWLTGQSSEYNPELAPWVEPLRALVSRATATLAVELPIHHSVEGIGRYAGSCDGLVLVGSDVVVIDYKTKRPGKRVHPRFLDKQRTQLAAYALAINAIYVDQLPAPVTRCSLLFAHPDEGRPPTVVSTAGDELRQFQDRWLALLEEWFEQNGHLVEEQQVLYESQGLAA